MTSPPPVAPAPARELPPFRAISDMVRENAQTHPDNPVLIQGERRLSQREFDDLVDRIAASLQRDGVAAKEAVAVCATTSIEYAALYIGVVRAGAVTAPLAPSATPEQLAAMVRDCGARLFFTDRGVATALAGTQLPASVQRIALDDSAEAGRAFGDWLLPADSRPKAVEVQPDWPFNIIYSSGTTGTPKGIVQPHAMRWAQVARGEENGYGPGAVTLLSTPLYSNTTLVVFLPTLAKGGCSVLMPKFDAGGYLALAEQHRVTHTMLVPVQYQRLMDHPDFDRFDLSSFKFKFCTSAPFLPALKSAVLARWPGALIEFYGMTEGGGACALAAHLHPDKLHTVGQPFEGHDIRLIDENGREVPTGEAGEVVGRSGTMMIGYHNQPQKTAEAEWFDSEGRRYIRTGDVGRFDADGFLTLMDRRKDMIISGGFNIYPSDLEAILRKHPAVADVAVLGVPSREWGETPVAFVVRAPQATAGADEIKQWLNGQVGKTQRLSDLRLVEALPRSAIGKVLKRELRDSYTPQALSR